MQPRVRVRLRLSVRKRMRVRTRVRVRVTTKVRMRAWLSNGLLCVPKHTNTGNTPRTKHIPIDHESMAVVYSFVPSRISGARYHSVTTSCVYWVRAKREVIREEKVERKERGCRKERRQRCVGSN